MSTHSCTKRYSYGTSTVNCPGISIEITPPQAHIHLAELLRAGKLLINTVASGAEISKENLTSNEIISYRNNKIFEI